MNDLPIWLRASSGLINLMQAIGEPLSDAQEGALQGALAVWFDKAKAETLAEAMRKHESAR